MTGSIADALALQKSAPDSAVQIVATGEKFDGLATAQAKRLTRTSTHSRQFPEASTISTAEAELLVALWTAANARSSALACASILAAAIFGKSIPSSSDMIRKPSRM